MNSKMQLLQTLAEIKKEYNEARLRELELKGTLNKKEWIEFQHLNHLLGLIFDLEGQLQIV